MFVVALGTDDGVSGLSGVLPPGVLVGVLVPFGSVCLVVVLCFFVCVPGDFGGLCSGVLVLVGVFVTECFGDLCFLGVLGASGIICGIFTGKPSFWDSRTRCELLTTTSLPSSSHVKVGKFR